MIAQLLNSNTNLSDELLNVLEDLRRDIRVALDPSTDKSKIEIQDNSSHDRDEEKADWFTSKEYLDTIISNIDEYDYAESRFTVRFDYFNQYLPDRVQTHDSYSTPHYRNIINQLADELYPDSSIFYTNSVCYNGPSAYLSWHTNLNNVGDRTYITYASDSDKSFFRYLDPETQEIVTCYDKKGWQINEFYVNKDAPLWHCVFSDVDRISLGFRVVNNL